MLPVLLLCVIIIGFCVSCLLSQRWYTALGFAFLAIYNVWAAHPAKVSRFMLICLLAEGFVILSIFTTGKVLPTRTANLVIPVYGVTAANPNPETECTAFYGYFHYDSELFRGSFENSPKRQARHLCSRTWMMVLDISFTFIVGLFFILFFVNLYYYRRQKAAEREERGARNSSGRNRELANQTKVKFDTTETPLDEVELHGGSSEPM
jgi:hypothetical protein